MKVGTLVKINSEGFNKSGKVGIIKQKHRLHGVYDIEFSDGIQSPYHIGHIILADPGEIVKWRKDNV